jgi:hypothetical protein
MKLLFAIVSLTIPSLSHSAESVEFLKNSPLLRKAKLNVVPVEMSGTDKILFQVSWEGKENSYLLGNDGKLHELELKDPNKTYKTSVHMCGEDLKVPARTIKAPKTQAVGKFAVVGKIPSNMKISWEAAKIQKSPELPASCTAYKKGFRVQSEKTSLSTLLGIKKSFFFVHLSNEKFLGRKDDEPVDEKDCGPTEWHLQRIGVTEQGTCRTLVQAPVNCDGQGYGKGSIGSAIGMIRISQGKKSEQWIVFDAAGYEGSAYLGIKLTKKRPAPEADRHFYVFSGC